MAIEYLTGAVAHYAADNTTVTTSGIDTTGADLIVAFVCSSSFEVSTPTDSKGNSWTGATSRVDTDWGKFGRLWYCVPTSVGSSHTFSATTDPQLSYPTILVMAFSGVAASPFDQDTYADSGGVTVASIQGSSLTPSENNCLVVSVYTSRYDVGGQSINGSFTKDVFDLGAAWDAMAGAHLVQTTAAASAPTWSFTTNERLAMHLQASFKAAAGATGQFARPASDVADGDWVSQVPSSINLYQSIDETSFSDTDYIRSGATPSSDTCTIGLSSIATPQAGTVTLRVRARYV